MKKRLLSLALALAFCLSLVPGVTLTAKAEGTEYPLWVAGTQVTSENAADLSVIEGVTVGEGGEASYDASNNTLTLNGATITGLNSERIGAYSSSEADGGIVYSGTENFTINATGGTSTVTGGNTARDWSAGLFIGHPEDGYNYTSDFLQCNIDINISEGADLTLNGGVPTAANYPTSYGICMNSIGLLTISGTGTLNANGGRTDYSYGISTIGGLVINSTGTVNATGADNTTASYGINEGSYYMVANRSLTISGSGTVNATGGTAEQFSAGIYAYSRNGVLIDAAGGKINATGKAVTAYASPDDGSYGIFSYNTIEVRDGTVKAVAADVGAAGDISAGLFAFDASSAVITISGGTVEATAGTAPAPNEVTTVNSAGIYSAGAVAISGDSTDVTAEGLLAGIYAKTADIDVSGGTVTATAIGDDTITDHGYNGIGIRTDDPGKITFSGENTVVSAKGKKTSVFAQASITIESPLEIVLPVGGKMGFGDWKIVNSDGTNATDVLIKTPDSTPTSYPLWIAGTQVTSANAANLSVIDGVTVTDGGEASFNPATNTLTLKNASIDGAADITNTIYVPDGASEFNISFAGTNTITARNSSDYCRAVNALGADLVLSGEEEATLTIRANMSGGSAENGGLRVGSLTITGGTVTVECPTENYGPAHNPYSISLNKNATDVLKITGGKLISKGWEPLFYGPSAFTAEQVDSNTNLRGTMNTEGTGLEPYDYTTNSDYSGGSYNSTYRYVEAVPNEAGDINIAFTVTPPKAGETTAIIGSGAEISSDSSDYIIVGDQYATSVDNLNSFNYFEGTFAKSDYYSYALVIPADGSTITAITESDVSISGAEFVSAEVNDYGEARVYFKVTIDEDAEFIDTLNIEVTLPEDGQEYFDPDPTTEDANYTISSAAWLDSDDEVPDEFISGEDYSLDLLLKPARGYVFADTVSVSLNGNDPVEVDVAETLSFNEVLIPIMPKGTTLTLDIRCSNGATGTVEYMWDTDKTSTTLSITENTEIALPVPSGVATLSVRATPAEGYYINQAQTNDGTGTYTDKAALVAALLDHAEFTVTTDATITIEFDNHDGVPAPTPFGGGSGPAIYPIAAPVAENGTVTVSPAAASKGTTVTVTPKPDEGYEVDKVTVTDKDGNEIPVTDNGDGTYSFTMPSGKVTVNATFKEIDHSAVCPSKDFKDVDPDVWYHEAVDYVVEKGLMVGTADDKFDPNGTTTRAMIVTILYRLEGKPAVSGTSPFDDVASGQWYTDAVIWASENDIVSGYGDGKFGPTDEITREQFATILYRYAQYKDYDVSVGEDTNVLSYNDAFDVSEWAMPAIQWASGAGLMQGDNQGNLLPGDSATRAQAAALIMRFIENVK